MGKVQSIEKKGDVRCLERNDMDYCGIFGCVVLPSGNVVIADFYNRKVKTINMDTGDVLDSLTTTSGPTGVACVENTKVAVTLPDEKKVQLLHVTRRDTYITPDYRIKVDGHCMAIDFERNVFLISFVDPPQVQLVNINGVVLKTIRTDNRGYYIFKRPKSVYFARDMIHFFCCDSELNEVMKIRRDDGTVVAINREIRHPAGVIELPDYNILVAGSETNAMHLLPPDLKGQTQVLTSREDIGRPEALCLRQLGIRMFELIISNKSGSVLSPFNVTFF